MYPQNDWTDIGQHTYCPPNDMVHFNNQSQHIGSCLGDLYSINWMQNMDKLRINHDLKKTPPTQSDLNLFEYYIILLVKFSLKF